MLLPLILIVLLAVAIAYLTIQINKLKAENAAVKAESEASKQDTAAIKARFAGIVDVDAEKKRVLAEISAARLKALSEQQAATAKLTNDVTALKAQQNEYASSIQDAKARLQTLLAELKSVQDQLDFHSLGFYKPVFNFDTSEQFVMEIERVRNQQKAMLSAKSAAICHIQWTVNNSVVEGRKQTDQTLRLILRAFNGECDAAIAKVRYNNITVMETRIRKAFEAINKLVSVQQCEIVSPYLELKLKELRLTHEYQEKLQAEKEEQRRIREQMREEEIAQRELERAQADAEKEEKRYQDALSKARSEVGQAVGAKQAKLQAQIEQLEKALADAHEKKERALSRAQMTKSGHVYVISNIGSFGENVYKIGMTRRLDPMDRVRELGDASVPFLFDVHAIIYSNDAPALEAKLHRAFSDKRVNRVNEKREFFRVSIDEIAEVVRKNHGHIQMTKIAEAKEYRTTIAMSHGNRPAGPSVTMPPAAPRLVAAPPAVGAPPVVSSDSQGRFIVRTAGKDSFPMTDKQLYDLAHNGVITKDSEVFDRQTGQWAKASDMTALAVAMN